MSARLVVFSATWCPPCAALKKELKKAKVPFRIVDVDSSAGGRLADDLGIRSIPAVFVHHGGEYTRVRAPSAAAARAALERHE